MSLFDDEDDLSGYDEDLSGRYDDEDLSGNSNYDYKNSSTYSNKNTSGVKEYNIYSSSNPYYKSQINDSSRHNYRKKQMKVDRIFISFYFFVAFTMFALFFILLFGFVNMLGEDSNSSKNISNISKSNSVSSTQKNKTELFKEIDSVEDLDGLLDDTYINFQFLKLENKKKNIVYSPLSIKYALKMIELGAAGTSYEQIANSLENLTYTKYGSNEHMSFANAFFVMDMYEPEIRQDYRSKIYNYFEAEVIPDSLKNPDTINSWIENRTLGLIDNMLDEVHTSAIFYLVNALGIDMEWENKFLDNPTFISYAHENFDCTSTSMLSNHEFKNENNDLVSGMEFIACANKYDIFDALGKDYIEKMVSDAYEEYAYDTNIYHDEPEFNDSFTRDTYQKLLNDFLYGSTVKDNSGNTYTRAGYISSLNNNYRSIDYNTDFRFYVEDDVKVFAKDLKRYDDTTLEYIAIMPTLYDLESYVSVLDTTTINYLISNLKDLSLDSFDEGVITRVVGFMPKFNFDYDLDLKNDLIKLGITDIFDVNKADLSNMTKNFPSAFIGEAMHKANIELTQDGIKASAATLGGGWGAGDPFDLKFDVPIKEIDLTFDKPFMFLIRDKETGELWFTGTVYEPLLWDEDEDVVDYKDYPDHMFLSPEIGY